MNQPDPLVFRLPGPVVRRAFVLHTVVVLGALALLGLLSDRGSPAALAGGALLAVATLGVAYVFTARRVWFSVTPQGLQSVGYTGRKVELPWSVPLSASKARRSGQKGFMLVPASVAGSLTAGWHAIFVPAAIVSSPEFAAMVAAQAPPGHALRTLR